MRAFVVRSGSRLWPLRAGTKWCRRRHKTREDTGSEKHKTRKGKASEKRKTTEANASLHISEVRTVVAWRRPGTSRCRGEVSSEPLLFLVPQIHKQFDTARLRFAHHWEKIAPDLATLKANSRLSCVVSIFPVIGNAGIAENKPDQFGKTCFRADIV